MSRGTEQGYRRQRTVYTVRYAQHPGLWVRAKAPSTQTYIDLASKGENPNVETVIEMARTFIDNVLDWNLEDEDGTPVPTTMEALLAEEWDFMEDLVQGWMEAVAGTGDSLKKDSPGGERVIMDSIPMEPLSTNQAS